MHVLSTQNMLFTKNNYQLCTIILLNVSKGNRLIPPCVQHTDVCHNGGTIQSHTSVRGGLRILPGEQHADVYHNRCIIQHHTSVRGVFGFHRVYNTLM